MVDPLRNSIETRQDRVRRRRFAGGIGLIAVLLVGSLLQPLSAADSSEAALAKYADAANFQTNGAIDLAIEGWQEFLKRFPDDPLAPKAAHYLGVCYMQRTQPDHQAAANAFGTALESKQYDLREESLANRGWCLYAASGEEEERDPSMLRQAISTFAELIKSYPRSSYLDRAFFYSGESAYALGDTKAAINYYDRMLRSSQAKESPLRCDALYALGVAQEESQQWEGAVESYQKLLESCSDDALAADGRIRLADVYLQQGKTQESLALLEKAMEGEGENAAYAAFRRAFGMVQLDQPSQAAAAYDQVTERFPQSPYAAAAVMAAGQSYYRGGEIDKAAERFQQVLGQEDQEAATEAAHWLSQIAIRKGDHAQAEQIAAEQIADGVAGPYALTLKLDQAEAMSMDPPKLNEALDLFAAIYREDPSSSIAPRALYSASFAAMQAAEYQRAVSLAAEFLKRYAEHPLVVDVRYVSAESRLLAGNQAEAADEFAQLLQQEKENPQRPMWVLRGGTAAYLGGQYEQAIDILHGELDSLPQPAQKAEAWFLIGASQLFSGQPQKAVESLQASRQADPTWAKADEALLLTGQAQQQQGDAEAAVASWRQLVEEYPQSRMADQALYKIGQQAAGREAFGEAIEVYSTILDKQRDPALVPYALFGKGWCLLQQDKPQQAVAPLREFLDTYDSHPLRGQAELALGVSLRQLGETDAAERRLNAFLQQQPSGNALGHALYELALIDIDRNQPAQAVEKLQRVVNDVPEYSSMENVLYDLAWSLKEVGQTKPAEQRFEQLIARYPDNPLAAEARYFLGEQRYRAKDWQAAAAAFRTAAERTDDAQLAEKSLYRVGWSWYQVGEFEKADAAFQQQAESYPDGVLGMDALLMIGESRFKAGQHEQALAAYETARKRILAADDTEQSVSDRQDRQVRELVLLHGGQSAGQLERWKEALEWYDQLRERFPATAYLPQVFYESAYAQQQLGDDELALKLYAEVANKFRNEISARARFMMGEVHFANRDLARAIPEFQKVMYGFGAEKAAEPIKHWQARSGYEAGRCAELLVQSTQGEKRAESLKIAKGFFEYVISKHPDHALVGKAKERLAVLNRL